MNAEDPFELISKFISNVQRLSESSSSSHLSERLSDAYLNRLSAAASPIVSI